jgi:hypothetical protein
MNVLLWIKLGKNGVEIQLYLKAKMGKDDVERMYKPSTDCG